MNRGGLKLHAFSNWWLILTLLLLVTLSLFWATPANASAGEQAVPPGQITPIAGGSSCNALDVVFVIDQTYFADKEDPHRFRYEAVKWMMNIMGMDRLLSCPDTIHRLAVLDMDNHVQYDLTPLKPDYLSSPRQYDAWVTGQFEGFEPSDAKPRYFVDSLISASKILRDAPPLSGARKQAIIVLAGDQGIPCGVNEGCLLSELQSATYETIIDGLSENLPESPNGPFVYMLAFEDYDENIRQYLPYAKNFERVTDRFDGEYILVEDPLDMIKQLTEIYLTLNPNPEVKRVAPGSLYVDPFLQNFICYSFRDQSESQIVFRPPEVEGIDDDKLISPVNQSKTTVQTVYVYKHPVAGEWDLESNNKVLNYCQSIRVRDNDRTNLIRTPNLPSTLVQDRGDVYPAHVATYLSFQIPDNTGELMEEYNAFPARVLGVVTAQTTNQKFDLSFSYNGEAREYVSNQELPAETAGKHTWEITIYSLSGDPNDDSQRLVLRDSGEYMVNPVSTFSLILLKPTTDQQSLHNSFFEEDRLKVKPIEVVVRMVGEDGQNLDADTIFAQNSDLRKVISVTLKHQGDEDITQLEQNEMDKSLFNGNVGTEGDASKGNYFISASVDGTLNPNYAWDKKVEPVQFVREDGLWTNPLTYTGIAILIGLALLYIAWKLVIYFTNPVRGDLGFYYPGSLEPFYSLPLNQWHRRRVKHTPATSTAVSPLIKHIPQITAWMDKAGESVTVIVQEDENPANDPNANHERRLAPIPENEEWQAGKDPLRRGLRQEDRLNHGIYIRFHKKTS